MRVGLLADGVRLGEMTTGGDGSYRFAGRLPGRIYVVQEKNPPWVSFSSTPGKVSVSLGNGEDATADFGDWNGLPMWVPLVIRW